MILFVRKIDSGYTGIINLTTCRLSRKEILMQSCQLYYKPREILYQLVLRRASLYQFDKVFVLYAASKLNGSTGNQWR